MIAKIEIKIGKLWFRGYKIVIVERADRSLIDKEARQDDILSIKRDKKRERKKRDRERDIELCFRG